MLLNFTNDKLKSFQCRKFYAEKNQAKNFTSYKNLISESREKEPQSVKRVNKRERKNCSCTEPEITVYWGGILYDEKGPN